jgi:hypothetical protein
MVNFRFGQRRPAPTKFAHGDWWTTAMAFALNVLEIDAVRLKINSRPGSALAAYGYPNGWSSRACTADT